MENRMTKEQVVDVTIELLESLRVPVSLIDEIGTGLAGAAKNLRIVRQMMAKEAEIREESEQKAAEEAEEDAGDPAAE